MASPDTDARIMALAASIAATIQATSDVHSEGGFGDVMSALVTVSAGAIINMGGDFVDHFNATAMFRQQMVDLIATDRGELAALYGSPR